MRAFTIALAACLAASSVACKVAPPSGAMVRDETDTTEPGGQGEGGDPVTTIPSTGDEAKKALSNLTDGELDGVIDAVWILFNPAEGREKLQSDLYWCAIYAIWSAFPVGKLGKVDLKTLVKNNASGRGGRAVDVFNAVNMMKKLATGEQTTLQQRITAAYSVIQLFNQMLGGSKPASGIINLVDTFTSCGIAIVNGADQLIKDINQINKEYTTREIWNASNEALGPVAGPAVFVVIAGGEVVTQTGAAAGEALGEALYPSGPSAGVVPPRPAPETPRVSINTCCYCYRDLYEHYRLASDKLIRRDNWWSVTTNDGGAYCRATPDRNGYEQVPGIQSNGYPVYTQFAECQTVEVLGPCLLPPPIARDWPNASTHFTVQYRNFGETTWKNSSSP